MTNEELKSDWADEKARVIYDAYGRGNNHNETWLVHTIAATLRVEREAAKPKWQPIETAPEFHKVLVCDKNGNLGIAYVGVTNRFWGEGEEVFPICWMPLPDLPGSRAARKSEPPQQEPSK